MYGVFILSMKWIKATFSLEIKSKEKTPFLWLGITFEVITKMCISLQREFNSLSYKANHKFIG